MKILGIHDGHGASAALVENGRIIAAVQEERLSRKKNQGGFPELAVEEVLSIAGCGLGDVDKIVFAGTNSSNWNNELDCKSILFDEEWKFEKMKDSERMNWLIERGISEEKIKFEDHHLCHAVTGYYGQSEREKKKLIFTCDALGDMICASVNIASGERIEKITEVEQKESVAIIYSMIAFLMGFKPFEEEYKLMGLSPYGYDSSESERIADKLGKLVKFDEDNPMVWKRSGMWCEELLTFLEDVTRYQRFDNIAAGVQKFIERFYVRWVKNCIELTGVCDVCLSGGLFMNVKLNKAIMELDEVGSLFVFPSCGDETNSIGAAWLGAIESGDRIEPLNGFYLGGDFGDEIEDAVEGFAFRKNVKVRKHDDIEKETARLLAEGKIVARFKGASEFGARALGNRSILADASIEGVVRKINKMIKMRDFWMPFAPSMMDGDVNDVIENSKRMDAPYMILAFDVKPERVNDVIAAIHPADITCRPQVVTEKQNACYYRLLDYYKSMSGKTVLLNTSFNLHGSPMVYKPQDALEVFDSSGLQYLAIGNYLIEG